MNVTIQYGTGNSLTKTFPAGSSVGGIVADPTVRAALGYGQNVEAHVTGVPQPNTVTAQEGMVLKVHDKACTKQS